MNVNAILQVSKSKKIDVSSLNLLEKSVCYSNSIDYEVEMEEDVGGFWRKHQSP